MQRFVLLAGAAALALSVSAVSAQQAGKAKTPAFRSAASIDCSKQADAKGLHGKPRKSFRSRCMRGSAKGYKPSMKP